MELFFFSFWRISSIHFGIQFPCTFAPKQRTFPQSMETQHIEMTSKTVSSPTVILCTKEIDGVAVTQASKE